MTIATIADVEFGEELPVFEPDTSLDNVRRFTKAARWDGPRFTDHEAARKEGLPGALVPRRNADAAGGALALPGPWRSQIHRSEGDV